METWSAASSWRPATSSSKHELTDKFALEFELLSREQIETSVTGKPFVERNPLIVRFDMASRSETLQAKLMAAADWALVIVDEAHRLAASIAKSNIPSATNSAVRRQPRATLSVDDSNAAQWRLLLAAGDGAEISGCARGDSAISALARDQKGARLHYGMKTVLAILLTLPRPDLRARCPL
ncbi:MAG: hypothetical protein WAL59_10045 [Roseiarcus sp.]